jgi:TatD DNase family protein
VDILNEEGASEVGGIMHCFGGSVETAKQCIDMNFLISLGGPVTFKNAKKTKGSCNRDSLGETAN